MKKLKPTTPSQRHMQRYNFSSLDKVAPLKSKTRGKKRGSGRNAQGRITVRHRGGGHKRRYREIDFRQEKVDIPARVFSIEYDPNRPVRIARVHYADGEKRYILAPEGLAKNATVMTHSKKGLLEPGHRMKLSYIPQGTLVHNIELIPGKGGQIVRSAGSFARVLAAEGKYVQLVMPSTEVRMIARDSYASIGQLSHAEHNLVTIGKAGRSRHLGRRPSVRGSAMNPVDHPHGGGEGRTGIGLRRSKTPWGKPARGVKTRNKKNKSSQLIVRRRKKK